MHITTEIYQAILLAMTAIAAVVFVALFFVKAGYGLFSSSKWGPSLSNRAAWILMEAPAFFVFALAWIHSGRGLAMPAALFASLFLLHYAQRSFIFPLLMKGKSRMPFAIMLMGAIFNTANASLLALGLFLFTPESYQAGWDYLHDPVVILGLLIFIAGMAVNLHSDCVIRHLRKPGDTKHYLPSGGLYRHVTSANYFGEILEWTGFALASSLPAAWVFVWWTFANLAPRANAIHKRYCAEFGEDAVGKRKRLIPFIW